MWVLHRGVGGCFSETVFGQRLEGVQELALLLSGMGRY